MKKAVCLMAIIFITLVLSSCAKGDSTVFFGDKNNKFADTRMEQLFNATKQRNIDDFKKMFSKKAINEAENINIEIDDFLSFVQGEVVSWNRDDSPTVYDVVEQGSKSKQLITWYTLDTDEQNYLVLLVDYPIDTINPENAGLYSISILRAEDENKLVGTWEDLAIPGIYIMDN
jgi:hypothetical protein